MKKIILIAILFLTACNVGKKPQYTVTRYGTVPTSYVSKRSPTKDVFSTGDTLYTDYQYPSMYIIKKGGKDTVYIMPKQ